jgi:hypothetical protein
MNGSFGWGMWAQRDSAEKTSKFGPNVWAEPKEK